MVGVKVKTRSDMVRLIRKAKRANIEGLGHAGGAIRRAAMAGIRKARGPSVPGMPPHTRRGQLKRAIRYAVEKARDCVVIGPDYSTVGNVMLGHEFGGRFRGQRYPARPLMGPALEKVKDRLPSHWVGSVR